MKKKKPAVPPAVVDEQTLYRVALFDPRLAVALLGGIDKRWRLRKHGAPGPAAWDLVNAEGTFAEGEGHANGSTNNYVNDLWIRKVNYVVRAHRPIDVFKGPFDQPHPPIDFTLRIKSHNRYEIAPYSTPLEHLPRIFDLVCPDGFVLSHHGYIEARFYREELKLEKPLMNVCITFHGLRLPVRYDECTLAQAVKVLTRVGILPSPAKKRRRRRRKKKSHRPRVRAQLRKSRRKPNRRKS